MYTPPDFEGMSDEQIAKLAQDSDGAASCVYAITREEWEQLRQHNRT